MIFHGMNPLEAEGAGETEGGSSGGDNVVNSLSKTSFLYREGGWRILARQRVPKPSAALPRAAGRLPEDCHKLPAGRALPALPRVGRVGRAYHLKTLIKLAELDREICRQAAGRLPAVCGNLPAACRQVGVGLPGVWGSAARPPTLCAAPVKF